YYIKGNILKQFENFCEGILITNYFSLRLINQSPVVLHRENIDINAEVPWDPTLGNYFDKVIQERSDNENHFAIINISEIVDKIVRWKAVLPRVQPFYAVKCNDDPAILSVMASGGVNFDCASKNEIMSVLNVANCNRIVYANPCKQISHIKYAKENGVTKTMFDNKNELYKIKKHYSEADLFIRFCPPKTDKVMLPLGLKFGCSMSEVEELLQCAIDLNLNVVGISFHVGSGCWDLDAFPLAIQQARKIFDIAQSIGCKIEYLDIGGGYPGTDDGIVSFGQVSQGINEFLDKYFPVNMNIKIIAEPGRYFVTTCLTAFSNIIGKRTIFRTNDVTDDLIVDIAGCNKSDKSFMYYLNDGVYGLFNAVLTENSVPKFYACKSIDGKESELFDCSIWGPTCDCLDCLNKQCKMIECNIGDKVMCPNMGAYSTSIACTFNGMEIPEIMYCMKDDSRNYNTYPLQHFTNVKTQTKVRLDGSGSESEHYFEY
ncbi:hypothetical protein A3Q56_06662, partial [Intoshia linei]